MIQFEECLRKNKIVKTKPDKELANSEIREAEYDLESAKEELKKEGWKWSTDKAYYSMFHTIRGLLLMKGYKERYSHICAIIAFDEIFIKSGIIPNKFLEYIKQGKNRREDAIYSSVYSKEIANRYVDAAEELLNEAKKLIE